MKFATFKNARVIRSTWLEHAGRRLDCNPYMSGAIEAKELLDEINVPKDQLQSLVVNRGLYKGKLLKRTFVSPSSNGVLFLTTSGMLQAEHSHEPYLASKIAALDPECIVKKGMILISAAGTIGRMTYCGENLVGSFACSDILKVTPDESKIGSGYLYAFLASKYGLPLVVGGTYGAIIQHINEEHVANIPVPRFDPDIEARINALIQNAADKRSLADIKLKRGLECLHQQLGLPSLKLVAAPSTTPFSISLASGADIQTRMDAFFHSEYHRDVKHAFEASNIHQEKLCECVDSVIEPGRFKRVVLDSSSSGTPLFGTSAIFWNDPVKSYDLPKPLAKPYVVSLKTLLMPRSGQLSGVIGRVVMPYGAVIGSAVSEDAIRINCKSEIDAGFLFVFLSSAYGIRQLKCRAFGTSIPHLDVRNVEQTLVPSRSCSVWKTVGELGLEVSKLRGEAISHENEAKKLVENSIERGSATWPN